jgi:hypothetical protein
MIGSSGARGPLRAAHTRLALPLELPTLQAHSPNPAISHAGDVADWRPVDQVGESPGRVLGE